MSLPWSPCHVTRVRSEAHIESFPHPQVKTVELSSGLLEDYFDMSVKMSTYLLAFIVSDFLSISKMSQHGVKVMPTLGSHVLL